MIIGLDKNKIHKRLKIRLSIYFVVSILVLAVSVFHIFRDRASWILSSIGMVAGLIVGIVFSRMQKISWDEKASQVIGVFDAVGIFFLLVYMAVEIMRNKIVAYFVSGPSLIAVSFAVLSGIMYGRVLGIRGKIKEVFREQGLLNE